MGALVDFVDIRGFWVLVLEHVFKNSQKICEGVYFNRVADLISVVEVAASDRVGNITIYKFTFLVFIIILFNFDLPLNFCFLRVYIVNYNEGF